MYRSRLMRRRWIQLFFFLLTNGYLKGFVEGKIFKGSSKMICVPGLNCYSCPGALGACPLGSLQAVMGSMKYQMAFYVMGLMMFFGTIFGRLICGYMCPFGMIQDWLFRIKCKKMKLPQWLGYIRYGILIYFVILIPTIFTRSAGIGDPGFCKYICPSGTLFGAIPLLIKNEGLRPALGWLFGWKVFLLIGLLMSSIVIYRIFCQILCPLGLIYGWFNKVSFFGYKLNEDKCTDCKVCVSHCQMNLDPTQSLQSGSCIQCGRCRDVCKVQAIERKKL